MTAPRNETMIKIGIGTVIGAVLIVFAWFINLQAKNNEYFQTRIDKNRDLFNEMVDKTTYLKDHAELSFRMQEIDKNIENKLNNFQAVVHKRMSRTEDRIDKQLEAIQSKLDKLVENQGRIANDK